MDTTGPGSRRTEAAPSPLIPTFALDNISPGEAVRFWRSADLPGIELMTACNSNRLWRVFHEHYCFCVIPPVRANGESVALVRYRRREAVYGAGTISLMEPGELHANVRNRTSADFWVLNVEPDLFTTAGAELGVGSVPHFHTVMTDSPAVLQRFSAFYDSLLHGTVLERETRLAACIRSVLDIGGERHIERQPHAPTRMDIARDYLHEHFARSISLGELATLTGLSRFHFARAFANAFGLPPHAYQNQLRIAAAAAALRRGTPPGAISVGFFDQSHLTKHFKRVFGATPSTFATPTASLPTFRDETPSQAGLVRNR